MSYEVTVRSWVSWHSIAIRIPAFMFASTLLGADCHVQSSVVEVRMVPDWRGRWNRFGARRDRSTGVTVSTGFPRRVCSVSFWSDPRTCGPAARTVRGACWWGADRYRVLSSHWRCALGLRVSAGARAGLYASGAGRPSAGWCQSNPDGVCPRELVSAG